MHDADQQVSAIRWRKDALELLDQRALPLAERWVVCDSAGAVADAIGKMVVRGAPAIGIAAAYGLVLAAGRALKDDTDTATLTSALNEADRVLAASRPTAVNLFWALKRMRRRWEQALEGLGHHSGSENALKTIEAEAVAIHSEDLANNRLMASHGADYIHRLAGDSSKAELIITHCNTGSLATGGHGTALGVVRTLHASGSVELVYVDETRPWMQGARLTSWELLREGVPSALIVDSAAASMMARAVANGRKGWVIVGADRVAANGDVVNKIGTYSLAVLARYHGWKFMVVAPLSTFDPAVSSGADIEIEARPGIEITSVGPTPYAPEGVEAINPVFDVTPASLVDVLVSELGVIEAPDRERVGRWTAGNQLIDRDYKTL